MFGSPRSASKPRAANRGPGRLPAPHDGIAVDVWGQSAAQWRARRHAAG